MTVTETGIDDTLLSYMRCCVAPKEHLEDAGWRSEWTPDSGDPNLPLDVMSRLVEPVDFNTEAKVCLPAMPRSCSPSMGHVWHCLCEYLPRRGQPSLYGACCILRGRMSGLVLLACTGNAAEVHCSRKHRAAGNPWAACPFAVSVHVLLAVELLQQTGDGSWCCSRLRGTTRNPLPGAGDTRGNPNVLCAYVHGHAGDIDAMACRCWRH